jgi:hypothetical protein
MERPSLQERVRDLFSLWGALLLPITAWALQMSARYALQPWLCKHEHAASDLVTLAAVMLAVAGGVLGWLRLSRLRAYPDLHGSTQLHQRAQFMAALAIALCAMFVLVIIAQWIPERLLSPCPD